MTGQHRTIIILLLIITMSGCAELINAVNTTTTTTSASLTEQEVANGLKAALDRGTEIAVSKLSATNGYYGDELVKILLPPEAQTIIDNVNKIPGGQKLIDDLILSINRSAEEAAKEAAPVFKNSIRQMSIGDAFGILRGADDAATQYFKRTSYNELVNLYSPKMNAATSKDLVGGVSAIETWNALTGQWNKFAGSMAGKLAGAERVDTDLNQYLTKKALDGLFLKVEKEEAKIRNEVSARVTPILQKVFGSLD